MMSINFSPTQGTISKCAHTSFYLLTFLQRVINKLINYIKERLKKRIIVRLHAITRTFIYLQNMTSIINLQQSMYNKNYPLPYLLSKTK